MSNIILAQSYDYTAYTATGETADMPLSNLNKIQPSDLFQASTANSTIVIDLGEAKPINIFAILFTNLPSTATWEIRVSQTSATLSAGWIIRSGLFKAAGDPLHDERTHGVYFRAVPFHHRYIQIKITGGAVPGGKIRIGRLFIGQSFVPTWNNDWGAGHKINEGTTFQRTKSGSVIPNFAPSTTDYSIAFSYFTKDEAYGNFYDLQHFAAKGHPVLVIPDIDHSQLIRDISYGFMGIGKPVYQARFNEFSTTLKITGIE